MVLWLCLKNILSYRFMLKNLQVKWGKICDLLQNMQGKWGRQ